MKSLKAARVRSTKRLKTIAKTQSNSKSLIESKLSVSSANKPSTIMLPLSTIRPKNAKSLCAQIPMPLKTQLRARSVCMLVILIAAIVQFVLLHEHTNTSIQKDMKHRGTAIVQMYSYMSKMLNIYTVHFMASFLPVYYTQSSEFIEIYQKAVTKSVKDLSSLEASLSITKATISKNYYARWPTISVRQFL